jgi:hypothetical protein
LVLAVNEDQDLAFELVDKNGGVGREFVDVVEGKVLVCDYLIQIFL